jgi:hypothetical protein
VKSRACAVRRPTLTDRRKLATTSRLVCPLIE